MGEKGKSMGREGTQKMDALAGYGSSDDDDTSSPNHSGSEIDDQNGENEKMEEQMETSDVEEMGAESLNFNAASEYSSQLLRRMSCSGAELVELQLPPPPPGQPDQRTMQKAVQVVEKSNSGSAKRSISSVGQLAKDKSK